jgi:hypothetical protein
VTPAWKRPAVLILQIALLGAGVWFLAATARANWSALARFELAPAPAPLIAASLITAATWFGLVAVWARSLRWWRPPQHLPLGPALRIWFLTNLARYIPGTIWQFAGLATLASRQGVSPVAATGAVLFQQVTLLVTGAGVAFALMPRVARAWGAELSWGLAWGLVAALLLLGAVLVPTTGRWIRRAVARVAGRDVPWPEAPPRELAVYVSALTLPWIAYGVAFWWFGLALLGDNAPSLGLAVGAHTASYVAGIVAIVAPGGIVVREAALVAALSPAVGGEHALLLAVASRLWLILLELVTAVAILAWPRTPSPRTS